MRLAFAGADSSRRHQERRGNEQGSAQDGGGRAPAVPWSSSSRPSKARTIGGYLGSDYVVESSIGHIRDLPRNADEVPASYKDKPWARLGVDVDNGFEPLYIVTPDKKAQVAKLKALLKDVDELYLATDEDREGEAIAWHLVQALNPQLPVRRMVFHEITPSAIQAAVANPREINDDLVARPGDPPHPRPAVRLRGLAGAVEEGHAAAVGRPRPVGRDPGDRRARAGPDAVRQRRLLGHRRHVRRPRGRRRGRPGQPARRSTASWSPSTAPASPRGRDFGEDGQLTARAPTSCTSTRPPPARWPTPARGRAFAVTSVEDKPYTRRPSPPFMTSTLQQEAGRKLRLSSQQTMRTAQRLYENGYITYMRTDSTTLSETALERGAGAGAGAVRRPVRA